TKITQNRPRNRIVRLHSRARFRFGKQSVRHVDRSADGPWRWGFEMLDHVSTTDAGAQSRQRNADRIRAVAAETAVGVQPSATIIETDPALWRRKSRDARSAPVGGALKRAFDLCAASVGIILLAPLLSLIWLLVRIERAGGE